MAMKEINQYEFTPKRGDYDNMTIYENLDEFATFVKLLKENKVTAFEYLESLIAGQKMGSEIPVQISELEFLLLLLKTSNQ